MPVVSVIVPVFNLEDKIQRCIETLVNQTLKDIEIILVNDCSTDNTINILEDNKNKYNNIKVLNLGTNVRQGGRETGDLNCQRENTFALSMGMTILNWICWKNCMTALLLVDMILLIVITFRRMRMAI